MHLPLHYGMMLSKGNEQTKQNKLIDRYRKQIGGYKRGNGQEENKMDKGGQL